MITTKSQTSPFAQLEKLSYSNEANPIYYNVPTVLIIPNLKNGKVQSAHIAISFEGSQLLELEQVVSSGAIPFCLVPGLEGVIMVKPVILAPTKAPNYENIQSEICPEICIQIYKENSIPLNTSWSFELVEIPWKHLALSPVCLLKKKQQYN